MPKCVVLSSSIAYSSCNASLLREIFDLRPELFSVVGTDCVTWEDAMDWLCIEQKANDDDDYFCCTTSHPDETVTEVVEFAEQWCDLKGGNRDVKIIEI